MPSATSSQEVEDLVRQLYGLGLIRREISRHALAELGSQGFSALATVAVRGPMRASEVAHALGVDLSVASRQLGALSAQGYVERTPDPSDGRAQILTVTSAGRDALRESHQRMVEAFDAALAGWSRADLLTLTGLLGRLRDDFTPGAGSPEVPRT